MDQQIYLRHWYADLYEQQETETQDVAFALSTIGPAPQTVLEVACGGGRISVPLAEACHRVVGFDADPYMLATALRRGKGRSQPTFFQADAIRDDWGRDYDVVLLAGNLLLNIESDMDNAQAQRLLLCKAACSVRPGGRMFLDFDCFQRRDASPAPQREWVCFDGTDDWGTYGKYIVIGGAYDSRTGIDRGERRYEIAPADAEPFSVTRAVVKHFPFMEQVRGWLKQAGWEIEQLYGGYDRRPFSESTPGNRAILWATRVT